MKRRDALAVLGIFSVALTSRDTLAQPTRRRTPVLIGFLPDFWDFQKDLFVEAMAERGRMEGRDYMILRSGIDAPRIEEAARFIVEKNPDLIYVANTGYALAAHRLTKTIPIVMYVTGFPVEAGLANSLARPGKNVTGNAGYAGTGLFGKVFELLHAARPGIQRIGVLMSYVPPAHPREEVEPILQEMRDAAKSLQLTVRIEEIAKPEQLPAALAGLKAARTEALFVTSGPALWPEGSRVMQFAIENRLPTIADWPWDQTFEPLLTYSPPWQDLTRLAVAYVDRILKGEKPGELPIQRPAKFELIVNVRTAKAIGLSLSPAILLRADRVIE